MIMIILHVYYYRVRAGAWNPRKVLKLKNQFQGHLKSAWKMQNPRKCWKSAWKLHENIIEVDFDNGQT